MFSIEESYQSLADNSVSIFRLILISFSFHFLCNQHKCLLIMQTHLLSSTYYILINFHSSFWPNRCKKCTKLISSEEEYLHDGESIVHIQCYLCSNCHTSLAGKFYYRYKDPRQNEKKNLYCDSCYHRLAPVCFQCLKIIEDISLIYGERIYHPNCFRCDHCQIPFKGALVFPYENHVYCSKCYRIVQKDFHPAASDVLTLRCSVCRKKFEPGDLITQHQVWLLT
jgi:hypothetical protein